MLATARLHQHVIILNHTDFVQVAFVELFA